MIKLFIVAVFCLFVITINILYGEQIQNVFTKTENDKKEGYSSVISKLSGDNERYDSKKSNYDTNNYDVVYHDTPNAIFYQTGIPSVLPKTINVIDTSGKGIIELPFYGEDNVLPIYGNLNSFKYGTSSNYVPDYASSVYLGLYNK